MTNCRLVRTCRFSGLSEQTFVQRLVGRAEATRHDLIESALILPHHAYRDLRSLFFRITIDAGADGGEGDGLCAVLEREVERVAVAIREQRGFVRFAAMPHRADGVDGRLRRPLEAGGDSGLAGGAAAEFGAVLF